MGLQDRFILTGLVPPSRIPELTQAMDILVHPSRREGLARAIPQGQLAGCPVVVYDVDGNREGLIDGETGFLVPAFDARKLSARLAVLSEEQSLRRRMGDAGREFASRRFSARAMVDALEKVYADALS
jgi:glycosyltransferase involved in cell wall biosynthesis